MTNEYNKMLIDISFMILHMQKVSLLVNEAYKDAHQKSVQV